ncbi:uncharacterized protein CIMG_13151 [Coccidioides immitis RS]|uniref:Uncharacterized protein n=1 Tax=Coccidioides immitis (strain RS) TaxID=246410 RepID=A0A0E1RXX5_COCIM|nr:uncharacterized protein CIMG_13151 [Coccidioides immitis RS]EAS31919.2 hypothetical protein CIMG_13151 [Coccidioides immitis RS]
MPSNCDATGKQDYIPATWLLSRTLKKQLFRTEQIKFQSAAHQFGQVLKCLMICCTTETSWFDKPIMELPHNHHHDVLCSLESKIRDELQQSLLDLMKTEQCELKLTDEEMMENGWHAGGDKKNSPTWFTCLRCGCRSKATVLQQSIADKTHIHHYRQMNKAMYTYCLVCRDVQVKSNILDWQAMWKSFNELVMLLQREAGIVQDVIDLDTDHAALLSRCLDIIRDIWNNHDSPYQMCASIFSDAINCWYGACGLSFKKEDSLIQRCNTVPPKNEAADYWL